jgi:hypothetical protein
VVLGDVGDPDESPRYWIIPGAPAAEMVRNEQLVTEEIAEFENRWDLLDEPGE